MLRKAGFALILLVPSVCHAWGVEGHRIIAEIASENLTPEARAAVRSILGGKSMTDVCTWADEVRKQPEYIFTDRCHGVKIPVGAKGFEMKRDCPDGRCAPAAIAKYSAVLREPKATSVERLEALKFVIHFVADIHCPVHAPHAGGDAHVAGQVTFFGEKVSLHKVWDASLILRVDKPWQRYATDLNREITFEQRRTWAKVKDPVDWANESHRAFVEYAAVAPEHSALGEEYYRRSIPIVNERLSQGGIRLASLLNNLLGEGASTRPATTMAP
jgi:nuclease S1